MTNEPDDCENFRETRENAGAVRLIRRRTVAAYLSPLPIEIYLDDG